MAPACRGGNVSACAKFPEHAHFFHTVVLLIVIVGNSIRLASEVKLDRARQRRVREACDLRHALATLCCRRSLRLAVKVSGVARTDIASHSARSRACWRVGFAIPMPEGSKPEGKGLDGRGANRLLAPAEAGRHLVERSGSLGERREAGVP